MLAGSIMKDSDGGPGSEKLTILDSAEWIGSVTAVQSGAFATGAILKIGEVRNRDLRRLLSMEQR
jgi:hypothetical protein